MRSATRFMNTRVSSTTACPPNTCTSWSVCWCSARLLICVCWSVSFFGNIRVYAREPHWQNRSCSRWWYYSWDHPALADHELWCKYTTHIFCPGLYFLTLLDRFRWGTHPKPFAMNPCKTNFIVFGFCFLIARADFPPKQGAHDRPWAFLWVPRSQQQGIIQALR